MLTRAQAGHVQRVYPECKKPMADFLLRGVDVIISIQDECGADVPPFAIRVVEDPTFWIDCAHSTNAARRIAKRLGLRVVDQVQGGTS